MAALVSRCDAQHENDETIETRVLEERQEVTADEPSQAFDSVRVRVTYMNAISRRNLSEVLALNGSGARAAGDTAAHSTARHRTERGSAGRQ
jgi:hypothetical protein